MSRAAHRYGFDRSTTRWDEVVNDDDVELYDNSDPNNLHAESAIAAAEAGMHVVCEKPIERSRSYRAVEVCNAIFHSASDGRRVTIEYR